MNPIGELLTLGDVRADLDVSSKVELLEAVAVMLASRHALSKTTILEALVARESLGSTGVGHGVAIPHARMNQCVAPAAVFVRTRIGVPFDAPDGRPVSIFLGLIVPNRATERHLQLLAAAAEMLGDKAFRSQLKTAPDAMALRGLLTAWSTGSVP